jgi:hypothetical protein
MTTPCWRTSRLSREGAACAAFWTVGLSHPPQPPSAPQRHPAGLHATALSLQTAKGSVCIATCRASAAYRRNVLTNDGGPRPWRPGCSTTTLTTLWRTRRTPTNQPPATNLMAVTPSHLRHRLDCNVPAQWSSAASRRSQRVDAELTSFSTAFAGSPKSTKHAVVAHCRLGGPTGMHLPAASPCMSQRPRVGRHCSGCERASRTFRLVVVPSARKGVLTTVTYSVRLVIR